MKITYIYILLFTSLCVFSQQENKIEAFLKNQGKTIEVKQSIQFQNTSNNDLLEIDLQDWNFALSTKNSAIANKFSDEYNRSFHLSSKKERSNTEIGSINDNFTDNLDYYRDKNHCDIIHLKLKTPLKPNEIRTFNLFYTLTLPDSKFTRFGWYNQNKIYLKNCFINLCSFNDGIFLNQSESNLDDITTNLSDISISLYYEQPYYVTSDLDEISKTDSKTDLRGSNRNNFVIILETKNSFEYFNNEYIKAVTNIKSKRVNDFERVILIDRIAAFTFKNLGKSSQEKIVITNEDYDREPFYGLNELPSFISPFNDDFIFELKFLKTYLNNYLTANLHLNFRKDHWILEGIQHYYIKKYIEEFYPDIKAFGKLADYKILKGYKIINMPFSEQFLYNYLLMARKNIDQPIGYEKDLLIKFNEKIAGKFKAGLLLNYTASLMGEEKFESIIKQFVATNQTTKQVSREQFYELLNNQNSSDFWLKDLVEKDEVTDLTIRNTKRTKETIEFDIVTKNKTKLPYTYALYKNKELIKSVQDTIVSNKHLSFNKTEYDYIELNDKNLLTELDNKNNFKKFKPSLFGNKPLKFTFFKDIENPKYNQVFFVPTGEYNLYDGILLGMKINNRSVIDRPFNYSITPNYSTKTNTLAGSVGFGYNQYFKNSTHFATRYGIGFTRLHYLQDAFYTKFTPSISFNFRNKDLRKNEGQSILFRQVYVHQEKSAFAKKDYENYSVFNARYNYYKSELVHQFFYNTDLQVANTFSKVSGTIQYRKLFQNNRYITLRAFGGFFMYNDNKTSNFFSFGVDRPSDYLFDYPLLGRSESTGLYSQQYVYGEGGFKSKFNQRYANQYIFTINASLNIWNWIEVYGDVGTFKNKTFNPKFVYDSGIHLNLVQDYFELFFPVYSSNGFELNDKNYGEKIRFVITLNPKILTSLFTRRWF